MGRLLLSVFVGLVVAVVVWFGISVNTWSVIHRGWSQSAVKAFFVAVWVVPVVVGSLAASWTYRQVNHQSRSSRPRRRPLR